MYNPVSSSRGGAVFSNSYALTHPSQPNYIELFSGSNQGVTDNQIPVQPIKAPSLGGQLFAAGLSFAGYAESLPAPGSLVEQEGPYVRRHNPWSNFADVPPSANLPFTHFPADFSELPTVSFVVPNLINDMHDASIEVGDRWLRDNLGAYAQWAQTHNSLLIVTFDEGLGSLHIPTIFYGQPVQPGVYTERIDHHRVLRTVEDMYGLAPLGAAANVAPITPVSRKPDDAGRSRTPFEFLPHPVRS